MFHLRKLPHRDYLLAIAIFVNGAKGHSTLQLSRDLNCRYKTAFVLAHKLREAMGSEVQNSDQPDLAGEVAIDGAYFGGKVKPANRKADRADRRTAEEQTGKRQVRGRRPRSAGPHTAVHRSAGKRCAAASSRATKPLAQTTQKAGSAVCAGTFAVHPRLRSVKDPQHGRFDLWEIGA